MPSDPPQPRRRPPRPPLDRRLYVSDLDGTLLLPDKSLGARTREVIERFVAAGGHFSVATGRSFASAAAQLAGLRLDLDIITHNGAATVDLGTGAITHRVAMDGPLIAALFAAAVEQGLCPVAYALHDGAGTRVLHGPQPNDTTRRYLASVASFHPLSEDRGPGLERLEGLSIIVLDQPPRIAGYFAAACQHRSEVVAYPGLSAYTPGLGVGEITAAGASKALAAERIAGELGLRREDIVAFGDNHNDLPLLLAAGEAYCPPDAPAPIRARVAGRILSPREEGVAAVLERLLAHRGG